MGGTGERAETPRKEHVMANLIRRSEPTTPAISWDPFEMMREMTAGWEPFPLLRRGLWGAPSAYAPEFDVRESKDGYGFKADLPGIEEKDLEITLAGNRLHISGKREAEMTTEGDRCYCAERSYGSFHRSFTLPEGADVDNARAELKNGVLNLFVPKTAEAQPRRINIQAAKSLKA